MGFLINLIPIQFRIYAALLALAVVIGGSAYAGWTVRDWKAASDAKAESDKALIDKTNYEKLAHAMVLESIRKDTQINDLQRSIQREIPKVTDGHQCFGAAAAELFDRAIQSVSDDPRRAARADPVPQDTEGATDAEVLDASNETIGLLNECRARIDAIRGVVKGPEGN